jgi:hypothetical protein
MNKRFEAEINKLTPGVQQIPPSAVISAPPMSSISIKPRINIQINSSLPTYSTGPLAFPTIPSMNNNNNAQSYSNLMPSTLAKPVNRIPTNGFVNFFLHPLICIFKTFY